MVTARRPPAASVNERAITPNLDNNVLWRFGATAPLRDCVHGRGVTVIFSGRLELLTTTMDEESPRTAVRSMTAGVTERPPPAASAPTRDALSATAVQAAARVRRGSWFMDIFMAWWWTR